MPKIWFSCNEETQKKLTAGVQPCEAQIMEFNADQSRARGHVQDCQGRPRLYIGDQIGQGLGQEAFPACVQCLEVIVVLNRYTKQELKKPRKYYYPLQIMYIMVIDWIFLFHYSSLKLINWFPNIYNSSEDLA